MDILSHHPCHHQWCCWFHYHGWGSSCSYCWRRRVSTTWSWPSSLVMYVQPYFQPCMCSHMPSIMHFCSHAVCSFQMHIPALSTRRNDPQTCLYGNVLLSTITLHTESFQTKFNFGLPQPYHPVSFTTDMWTWTDHQSLSLVSLWTRAIVAIQTCYGGHYLDWRGTPVKNWLSGDEKYWLRMALSIWFCCFLLCLVFFFGYFFVFFGAFYVELGLMIMALDISKGQRHWGYPWFNSALTMNWISPSMRALTGPNFAPVFLENFQRGVDNQIIQQSIWKVETISKFILTVFFLFC